MPGYPEVPFAEIIFLAGAVPFVTDANAVSRERGGHFSEIADKSSTGG
jgi:hypothetical protein